MKQFSNALIWSIILTGSVSFAALSEKNLMEELTGKKQPAAATNTAQMQNMKNAPLSLQHFMAGQRAVEQKNYILAIKHFNTVIKKYPLSAQVKPALVAKAKVYQEMGLQSQSQRNLKLAQLKTTQPVKAGLAKTQEKNKIIK